MSIHWSSSGSFLIHHYKSEIIKLYFVNIAERNPATQLIYSHDYTSDDLDRELIEREVQRNCPGFRPDFANPHEVEITHNRPRARFTDYYHYLC